MSITYSPTTRTAMESTRNTLMRCLRTYAQRIGVMNAQNTDGYNTLAVELADVLRWLKADTHDETETERVFSAAHDAIEEFHALLPELKEKSDYDDGMMKLRLAVQAEFTLMLAEKRPNANPSDIELVAAFKALTMTDDEILRLF